MTGKNLKFLRKYYGDTQSDLGKILNVGQSTISDYERGKQIPDCNLKKIAKRYKISVGDLIGKDLSLEFDAPKSILTKDIGDAGYKLIRIRTSDKAKKNKSFNRGIECYHNALEVETPEVLCNKFNVLDLAITHFQKAWEEVKTYVALANSISVVLLIHSYYTNNFKIWEILSKREQISTVDLHRIMLRDSKPNDSYEARRKSVFNKYEDLVYENIKLLKTCAQFSALGDYFSALCFILGFVDESIEHETSITVGVYMLLQLAQLDNKYAIDLLEQISLIS